MRSRSGTKLYAVRDSSGKFKDIQSYKRAHAADMRRTSKSEAAAATSAPLKKKVAKAAKQASKTVRSRVSSAVAAVKRAAKKVAKKVSAARSAAAKSVKPKVASAKKAVKKVVKKAVKKVVKKAAKKAAPKPAPRPASAVSMPRPAAPSPMAPVAAPPRIKAWHVVTSADTPSSIAQKYYGTSDPAKWTAVYEVNKTVIGPDPNQLKPGLLLRIPEA
jgi:hypothetical protein